MSHATKHGDPPSIVDASHELLDKATSNHISFKQEARSRHQKLDVCKAILEKHTLHHGYDFDAALNEMKKEFGVDEVPKDLVFFETPTKRMKKSMESEHPHKEEHPKKTTHKGAHKAEHKVEHKGEERQHEDTHEGKSHTPSKGKKAHHETEEPEEAATSVGKKPGHDEKHEKLEAEGEPEAATTPGKRGRKPSAGGGKGQGKAGSSSSSSGGDHDKGGTTVEEEHHTKWEEVANEENRKIVEMINEIASRYFKADHPEKGKAYALASKIIRESKEVIDSGEEAHHKRGIGEHIAQHIDEFLQTGKVGVLEELRKTTD